MRYDMVALIALVAIALLTYEAGSGRAANSIHDLPQPCAMANPPPALAHDLSHPSRALLQGSLTVIHRDDRLARVVTGMEVDIADSSTDQSRTPKIIEQATGELSLPNWPTDGGLFEMPIPVSMPTGGLGLLWIEADIGNQSPEPPLHFQLRRLWFSEHLDSGWATPRVLLQADHGILWETSRTIRYSAAGEPLLMIVARNQERRSIAFGSVSKGLQTLPMGDALSPVLSTFLVDDSGTLIVAALVETAKVYRLILMTSSDGGVHWSRPEMVWQGSARVQEIHLHQDNSRNLHLIWSPNPDSIRHLVRTVASMRWIEQPVASNEGVLFRWVSGIDRCGRLTIIREVMESMTDLGIERAHWQANVGWTTFSRLFPNYFGMHLFDGIDAEGGWYIGWTGHREAGLQQEFHGRESGNQQMHDLKVWIAAM